MFDALSDAECGRLIRALNRYTESGEKEHLPGSERFAYEIISRDIDRTRSFLKDKTTPDGKSFDTDTFFEEAVRKSYGGTEKHS